jgi:hypothetical protein
MSDLPVTTAVTTATTMYASTLQSSSVLVSMSPDGSNVCINWGEVERQALGRDPYLMPLAKALIAVRDRTYQSTGPQ